MSCIIIYACSKPSFKDSFFYMFRNQLPVSAASPWSEESLSAGELSPSSRASCLWPRRTLALGWFRQDEPWFRVEGDFLRAWRTSPVQLSWGPLSTLAPEKKFVKKQFKHTCMMLWRKREHQWCDCQYLPVSLWPPDSLLDSALLAPWLLCLCLGLELQGDTSLSPEPVPERFFLAWAFCLSWVTSPTNLELSMLWRLLFLQPCAFICCNRERWERKLHSRSQQPQKAPERQRKRASHLLTHREEKGWAEALVQKILIWRAEIWLLRVAPN